MLCLKGSSDCVRTSSNSSMIAQLTASSLAPVIKIMMKIIVENGTNKMCTRALWDRIKVTVHEESILSPVPRFKFDNKILNISIMVCKTIDKILKR